MKNQRSNLSHTHNGHSRRSHGRDLGKPIASRIGSYVPSDPAYRYGIPAGVAIAGLAATGYIFRQQVFSIARTVFDFASLGNLLRLVGLERSRPLPIKIAPAAGALAVGLLAGAGATVLYTRARAQRQATTVEERAEEGAMDIAP